MTTIRQSNTMLTEVSQEAFYKALNPTTNVTATIVGEWDEKRGYQTDFTRSGKLWGRRFGGDAHGQGKGKQFFLALDTTR